MLRSLQGVRMYDSYSIKLIYKRFKQHEPSNEFKEAHTHAALIDLFIRFKIHATQNSASILSLETERDRTIALLALSGNPRYSVVVLD